MECWNERPRPRHHHPCRAQSGGLLIADHFEPELPRDPVTTVKRLIEVLEHDELAASIKRLENGYRLRVVK
jgi:hypothetical protein